MAEELPNIILVVFDTARWDRFGCYGYDRPTTPTVDAMARDGLKVETMIANAPWTLPSHGSLFTGLYPSEHGSQWKTGPRLRDSAAPTMAEWLKRLGYTTACVTNNGLISPRTGLARGFDHYAFRLDIERGRRRVTRRVRKALFGGDSGGRVVNRWMRKALRDAPEPLFLFVNYLECHWAYAPPRRLEKRVGGPRLSFADGLQYRARIAARVGPWEAVARAADDQERLEAYRTLYDGELASVDEHLAELIEILIQTGHFGRDRSLLLVTSDHGEHIGEHPRDGRPGLADHHASLDDHLIRVPFVAWGPGIVSPGERTGLHEFVDVLPSLARLLGEASPNPLLEQRRSDLFAPEPDGSGEEYAFAEWRSWVEKERERLARRNPSYDFTGLGRDLVCVRDNRFKLTRSEDGTEALYDTVEDPEEERDVSSELPETVRKLREQLDRAIDTWREREEAPAQITEGEQAEIEARLSELGYI
jgi:arylsulfatase A-like enzyme